MNCPRCGSEFTFFSKKREINICEDCGEEFSDKKNEKMRIFLSYGHDCNEPLVRKICHYLRDRGHEVWIDRSEIKTGDNWRRSITEGLLSSDTVLSFLSKHSTRIPGVCLDELRIAIGINTSVVKTILLENEKDVNPPAMVSEIQWLDMHEWKERLDENEEDFEKWFSLCMAALTKCLESDSTVQFSGEITSIKKKLGANVSSWKLQRLLRKSTYVEQWLFESIEKWIDEGNSGSLVLYGPPASGKSVFAANYIMNSPNVVGYIFCDSSMKNPRQIILSLCLQLASKIPDYRKIILEISEEEINCSADLKSITELLLINPLNLLIDGGRGTSVIVIDGLDELSVGSFLDCVNEFVSSTPSWLKTIILSRAESLIVQSLKNCDMLSLKTEEHNRCIAEYCTQYLGRDLSEEIVGNCDGSFLYADLMIKQVQQGGDLRDNSIPADIDSIYRSYCDRLKLDYSKVRKLLEPVVSYIPIDSRRLASFTGLSPYEVNDVLIDLGSLLEKEHMLTYESDNHKVNMFRYVPFHKSFVDWLSDSERSGRYYVNPDEGLHSAINYMVQTKIYTFNPFVTDYLLDQRFIYDNLAEYLAKLNQWPQLESFLITGQVISATDQKTSDSSQHSAPLVPYFYSIIHFPEGWDMSGVYRAIDSYCKLCSDYIRNGSPSKGITLLKEIMMFWAHVLVNDALCDMFENFIKTNWWIPKLFVSSFSDSYNHPGLVGMFNKDKLTISLVTAHACERYLLVKGKHSNEVRDYSNMLKIKSLYYEGNFHWDVSDCTFFEINESLWPFFKGQICDMNPANLEDYQQMCMFNSICALIELKSESPDKEYLDRLRHNGSWF